MRSSGAIMAGVTLAEAGNHGGKMLAFQVVCCGAATARRGILYRRVTAAPQPLLN